MDLPTIINYATAAISAAAVFCALIPKPAPGSVWSKVYAAIEILAANFGNAKTPPSK